MFINDGAKIRFFQEHIFDFQINNFVLLRPKTQKKIMNLSLKLQ